MERSDIGAIVSDMSILNAKWRLRSMEDWVDSGCAVSSRTVVLTVDMAAAYYGNVSSPGEGFRLRMQGAQQLRDDLHWSTG